MICVLKYLTHTQPYILFLVSIILKFMCSPLVHHLRVGKNILYVHGSINYEILYQHGFEFDFFSYSSID